MPQQLPDRVAWSQLTPEQHARWHAEMRERTRYVLLDLAIAVGLLSQQAAKSPTAARDLLILGCAAVAAAVDVFLTWNALPLRNALAWLCMLAVLFVAVSGFFAHVNPLLAVFDLIVLLFLIGMFVACRDTIWARVTGVGPTDPTVRV